MTEETATPTHATAETPSEMPPGYNGQVITAGKDTVFAWEKNGDLDPFLHPEQIGRMPPKDRCFKTPEECTAAAWADYQRATA